MNNARFVSRPRPGGKSKTESQSTGKKKWLVLAALFLVLSSLGAWAMLPRTDPQLVKVQELRAQLENAPPEQRRELWGQMRKEVEKLPEETREQLFADRRREWEARENKQLEEFFSKSRAEQIALIDKEIDESEQRRVEREKRRTQGGQAGRVDGQRGGRGGPGGWGGRGGGGRNSDPAARLARSKRYLDNSTPQSRAQRAEHRRMRDERRQQRGLPA